MGTTMQEKTEVPQWRSISGSWAHTVTGYLWSIEPETEDRFPRVRGGWEEWMKGKALLLQHDDEIVFVMTSERTPPPVPTGYVIEQMTSWGDASNHEAFEPASFYEVGVTPHDLAVGAEILQLDIGATDGKVLMVRVPAAEEVEALEARSTILHGWKAPPFRWQLVPGQSLEWCRGYEWEINQIELSSLGPPEGWQAWFGDKAIVAWDEGEWAVVITPSPLAPDMPEGWVLDRWRGNRPVEASDFVRLVAPNEHYDGFEGPVVYLRSLKQEG